MFGLLGLWSHRRFWGMLASHGYGRLNERQIGKLEQHLATCSRCRWEVETIRGTVDLLHSLPRAVPQRTFVLSKRPLALPATPAYLWGMRAATSGAALALVLLLVGDLLGTFSRDVASPDGPTLQAVQETGADTGQMLQSAAESGALPSMAAEEAPSPRDALGASEEASVPQAGVEGEESLPLKVLEVALGGLLAGLALLTLIVTWRLRRRWVAI